MKTNFFQKSFEMLRNLEHHIEEQMRQIALPEHLNKTTDYLFSGSDQKPLSIIFEKNNQLETAIKIQGLEDNFNFKKGSNLPIEVHNNILWIKDRDNSIRVEYIPHYDYLEVKIKQHPSPQKVDASNKKEELQSEAKNISSESVYRMIQRGETVHSKLLLNEATIKYYKNRDTLEIIIPHYQIPSKHIPVQIIE